MRICEEKLVFICQTSFYKSVLKAFGNWGASCVIEMHRRLLNFENVIFILIFIEGFWLHCTGKQCEEYLWNFRSPQSSCSEEQLIAFLLNSLD